MARAVDLTGQQFGRLTVVERAGQTPAGNSLWRCSCSCGGQVVARAQRLRGGQKSCGCIGREQRTRHGLRCLPEYDVWKAMVRRCTVPEAAGYADYGARGITVCARWLSVENFVADMGRRPSLGHTLERKDNSLGYEPSNCVWATRTEQNNNTRRNRFITYGDRTMTLAQWAREAGVKPDAIRDRIRSGKSPEEVVGGVIGY